jgi:hypothetical protein
MKVAFVTVHGGRKEFDSATLEAIYQPVGDNHAAISYECVAGKDHLSIQRRSVREDLQSVFERFALIGWCQFTGVNGTPVFINPREIAAVEYDNRVMFATPNDEGSLIVTLGRNYIGVSELPNEVIAKANDADFIKFPQFDTEPSRCGSDVYIARGVAMCVMPHIHDPSKATVVLRDHGCDIDDDPRRVASRLEAQFHNDWRSQPVPPRIAERIRFISSLG